MNAQQISLYTVGHSSRSLPQLIDVLCAARIACLVDVRRYPRSQRHPQFDSANLRSACEAISITYHWAGKQLGGFREPETDSRHTALPDGLRSYADYMDTEEFRKHVAWLISLAQGAATAILCAEKQPRDCHRGLISDYLIMNGVRVMHLIDLDTQEAHVLNPCARLGGGRLSYDRLTQEALPFDT